MYIRTPLTRVAQCAVWGAGTSLLPRPPHSCADECLRCSAGGAGSGRTFPRSLACFSDAPPGSGGRCTGRVSCSFLESGDSQKLLTAWSRVSAAGVAHWKPPSLSGTSSRFQECGPIFPPAVCRPAPSSLFCSWRVAALSPFLNCCPVGLSSRFCVILLGVDRL